MATGANQVRDLASGIAQHRHAPILHLNTACLPTLNDPAFGPGPDQRLHRVPKRERFAVKAASDATSTHPAPSDHNMRWATTALQSVCATLGPQLLVVVEVLRALSGRARRNASPLSADESCEKGARISCDKCLRAGWGGFEHRDRISTYGEY